MMNFWMNFFDDEAIKKFESLPYYELAAKPQNPNFMLVNDDIQPFSDKFTNNSVWLWLL